ncbi:hypothetical protein D3C71_1645270 [compost metagenome]
MRRPRARAAIEAVTIRVGMFIVCVLLGVQALTKPREIQAALLPVLLKLQRQYPFRWPWQRKPGARGRWSGPTNHS